MSNVLIFTEDDKIERAFIDASMEFFKNDNGQIVVKINNIYFPTNMDQLYLDMKAYNDKISCGPFCLKRTPNVERLYELYDSYFLENNIVCTDDFVPQNDY